MKSTIRWILFALVPAVIAGCGTSVKLDDEAGLQEPAPIESRAGADGRAEGAGAAGIGDRSAEAGRSGQTDPLDDPASPLSQRSVYFDFDSFVVRDEFRPLVEAHANYLLSHSERRVVIQGNTDERGSREYNLALGQKRAEAVRRGMAVLGVPDSRMEAVSFGEERPRATGNDEAAHAENRRADLVYP